MIGHAPKIKMMKEHGRHLRLDDEAEKRLLAGASACKWRQRTRELFRDIVILMRDTGDEKPRGTLLVRIENLDWENRVIFVPDSKTPEGRRLVPMSRRVLELLRTRCGTRAEGWVFSSKRSAAGHLCSIDRLFREARQQAGLPKELVLYCAVRRQHGVGQRSSRIAHSDHDFGPAPIEFGALRGCGGHSAQIEYPVEFQICLEHRNLEERTAPFFGRDLESSRSSCGKHQVHAVLRRICWRSRWNAVGDGQGRSEKVC